MTVIIISALIALVSILGLAFYEYKSGGMWALCLVIGLISIAVFFISLEEYTNEEVHQIECYK